MSLHNWSLADLRSWDEQIQAVARGLGLAPFPVDFQVVDWEQMMTVHAYHMPNAFGCWQRGKSYELTRALKKADLTHLAYETVINNNPARAYLLRDNSLPTQVLVMAHVYAHSDFFANSLSHRMRTKPERAIAQFRAHAEEIDAYRRDPSVPQDRLEQVIDAALALQYQSPRSVTRRRETREQQQDRLREAHRDPPREWDHLLPRKERRQTEIDLRKVPLEPDDNLLLFLAEYAPLQEWERRILQIVADEWAYFVANGETKVMNEGWATYWQQRIFELLDRPGEFDVEYAQTWSRIVVPSKYHCNPYHLGYHIWCDVERRWERPDEKERTERGRKGGEGKARMFEVRSTDVDQTFIGNYLTDALIAELQLYRFQWAGETNDRTLYQITHVPGKEGYDHIRHTVMQNVGLNPLPMVEVHDANIYGNRELVLGHVHDGRDLKVFEPEFTRTQVEQKGAAWRVGDIRHVLHHIVALWQNPVVLHTRYDGAHLQIRCDRDGKVVSKFS